MADPDPVRAQSGNLAAIEVDAVGEPGARLQPADAFEIVDGSKAEPLKAEVGLVVGLEELMDA